MKLRNRETGDVVLESTFRSNHCNVSLPKDLTDAVVNDLGYDTVLDGTRPTTSTPYQSVRSDGVEEIDGQWFTRFIVYTETDPDVIQAIDNKQADLVRETRTELLKDTDWATLSDVTTPDGYLVYRQQLRDITSQDGFPYNVTWPIKPS